MAGTVALIGPIGDFHVFEVDHGAQVTVQAPSLSKAQVYRRVICEINHRYDPHFESIRHIDRKWRNNLIESDRAAMKRLLGYRQSFRSLRTAKATLSGIETIRTIKRGHIYYKQPGVRVEIAFIDSLFNAAA